MSGTQSQQLATELTMICGEDSQAVCRCSAEGVCPACTQLWFEALLVCAHGWLVWWHRMFVAEMVSG